MRVRWSITAILLIALLSSSRTEALILNTTSLEPCSKTCESRHCASKATDSFLRIAPFLLRYGKYCGAGYTGCQGENPCDGLDACCQAHDYCVGGDLSNYLNKTCNEILLNCVKEFKYSGNPHFSTSSCDAGTVEDVIEIVMEIAIRIHS